mgnify:CR=1 FL=1
MLGKKLRAAQSPIEQAILPSTVPDAARTRAFAWYNVLQDAGHALGALMAGLPTLLRHVGDMSETASFRGSFVLNAALILVPALLYLRLSPGVEVSSPHLERKRLSPQSRRMLVRISSLFALDSLGGGFLTTALVSLFFYKRFGSWYSKDYTYQACSGCTNSSPAILTPAPGGTFPGSSVTFTWNILSMTGMIQ